MAVFSSSFSVQLFSWLILRLKQKMRSFLPSFFAAKYQNAVKLSFSPKYLYSRRFKSKPHRDASKPSLISKVSRFFRLNSTQQWQLFKRRTKARTDCTKRISTSSQLRQLILRRRPKSTWIWRTRITRDCTKSTVPRRSRHTSEVSRSCRFRSWIR